ncbi:hypothetical protein EV44_g3397 [Erysiphe necator]|uniref:Uncharacterized protein n=1 Tax=Uncinula necator TaxID=52586 RepID=A0A0B1P7R9_UNCNE|nr:hypothetical protein EV44_g3397 [Erysiphe necator]
MYPTEKRIPPLMFNSRYPGNETMAPLANNPSLPPEPPDAGNHVSKMKTLSTLRKAEAIEKALHESHCSTGEIIGTEDDMMNEDMSNASDSVFGGESQELPYLSVQITGIF